MTLPLLADFSLRLACGLAAMLLLTPWRVVPPAFFRTNCSVMLGLAVLASLDVYGRGARGPALAAVVAAAVLSYAAGVAWGLGLPRVGLPVTALVALSTASLLVAVSRSGDPSVWAVNGAGRLASALLMGSTLTAMLLGHYYLTAPAMAIDPLVRFVRCVAMSLGLRAALAAVGLALLTGGWGAVSESSGAVSPLFLGVRWGVGLFAPSVAAVLTWKTVRIRSTQSATGILYIAMTLVLFGELTAMALTHDAGVTL